MISLLAQAASEDLQKAFADALKAAAPEIARGTAKAIEAQPGTGLMLWAVGILAAVGIAGLVLLLRYLTTRDRQVVSQTSEFMTQLAEGRAHLEVMSTSFADRASDSQRSCHEHSKTMMELRNQGDVILREHARDLKELSADLRVGVHDFKNTAQAVKYVVETALDHKPPTVVVQSNNPPRSSVIEPGT
jgi:hypothetical protein